LHAVTALRGRVTTTPSARHSGAISCGVSLTSFSSPVGIATRHEGWFLVRWTSGGLEF
jgi:hypothetical protein